MARIQQETRAISMGTPLGDDVLVLAELVTQERLGRLFEYEVVALSEDPEIKGLDLLGKNITIRLEKETEGTRYFNGYVSAFHTLPNTGLLSKYRISLRPWLWFLTRTSDCRIFQELTVPDIIKQIFRDHGFSDFEEKLSQTYRTWEYCVQYRETDFDFVSRLMEHEGIYYYFKHTNGKHTLVFADSLSSHEKSAGYEEIPYFPPSQTALRERDSL